MLRMSCCACSLSWPFRKQACHAELQCYWSNAVMLAWWHCTDDHHVYKPPCLQAKQPTSITNPRGTLLWIRFCCQLRCSRLISMFILIVWMFPKILVCAACRRLDHGGPCLKHAQLSSPLLLPRDNYNITRAWPQGAVVSTLTQCHWYSQNGLLSSAEECLSQQRTCTH